MGIWERLKSALGGGSSGGSDRDGLYLYVRCGRCGDVVRVRVNLANELQQDFSDSGGISGYALRKVVIDATCFRPMPVDMTFDAGRRELSREIEGGEFVDQEAYEAIRAARSDADEGRAGS